MVKKPALRCQDCLQFEHVTGRCAWGIIECEKTGGSNSIHADICPLFTDQNGYAPLLDCDEDQLPAWYRQKELIKDELPTLKPDHSAISPTKKKTRKKKTKGKNQQLEFLSTNLG